jgi:NAD(P)H-dependent flavin oxidoreductase YrpB (nitropropane dioxygenase family)
VAALALGACGVWCGTAFLYTYKANLLQAFKDKVLRGAEKDTRVTGVLTGNTARLVTNKLAETWEAEQGPILPFLVQMLVANDLLQIMTDGEVTEHFITPAGQICGSINEMKCAKQVVKEIR